METRSPENWHLPFQGIYCAIGDGRIRSGSLVEQMYRMRWLGLRLVTNPTRAHVLARRRPHDSVYLLTSNDHCSRAEHPDLEPSSLSTVMRRWVGQRVDVFWGQSHRDVERVLGACRAEDLPVYIAIETDGSENNDQAFSERFAQIYAGASFSGDGNTRQYRIRRAHRARAERQRSGASEASRDVQGLSGTTVDETVVNLANWAKHEKLRRLEQRTLVERLGLGGRSN